MGTIPCLPSRKREEIKFRSQMIELKGQRDELESYKSTLNARIACLTTLSVQYAKENDRKHALFTLRKRALIQRQVAIMDEFLIKILTVISDAETAMVQLNVLKHIEIGAKLIKAISSEIKNKDYDSLMEIESECMDNIANAMGMYTSKYCKVGDDDLLKELDTLTSPENVTEIHIPVEAVTPFSHAKDNGSKNTELEVNRNTVLENLKEPVVI